MFKHNIVIITLAISAISIDALHSGNVQHLEGGPYVQHLEGAETFNKYKSNPGVRLVYFYKPAQNKDTVHEQKTFLVEYEKSAQIISAYDVMFAKVDCPDVPQYCEKEGIQDRVVVFRNGLELLMLDLENMFDMDSIVSNVLQIVLLREVPIVQKPEEKQTFLDQQKGKFDVIFSFQNVIGTHAHRVFMEIAFAYQSRYKFAITTEADVVKDLMFYNEADQAAMWLINCKEVSQQSDTCKQHKYWGSMDLRSMAKFIKVIEKPLIHEITMQGEKNLFGDLDIDRVMVYYDDLSYAEVMREISNILQGFYGLVGITMINVNQVKAGSYGFDYSRMKVPTLAFQYNGETTYNIMPHDLSPSIFVNNQLSKNMPSVFPKKTAEGIPVSTLVSDNEQDPDDENIIPDEDASFKENLTPEELARMNEMEIIETQDDHVASAVWKMRKVKLDRTHVPALTDKTFYKEVEERELLVVLFYVKFDPRGMAFLHHYVAASHDLAAQDDPSVHQPLSAVDCFDWTDVCGKVNVTSYPTVRIYRRGQEPVTYRGMLSQQDMVSTVHMFLAKSPIHLKTDKDQVDFIGGDLPANIGKYTDSAIVGIFKQHHRKEMEIFKKTAAEYEGKLVFAYLTISFAGEVPATVVIHKRDDPLDPQASYSGVFTQEKLSQFISDEVLVLFPELTVSNLPSYMRRKNPLLILFTTTPHDDPRSPYVTMSKMVAAEDDVQDEPITGVQFCWMNVSNPNSVAAKVLSEYSPVHAVSPHSLALVNHAQGTVHMYSEQHITSLTHLTEWVNSVLTGNIPPTKMLDNKEWKPRHPGYDFNKMIEEEKYGVKIEDQQDGSIEHQSSTSQTELPDAQVRAELHMERSRFRHKLHDSPQTHSHTKTADGGAGDNKHTEL